MFAWKGCTPERELFRVHGGIFLRLKRNCNPVRRGNKCTLRKGVRNYPDYGGMHLEGVTVKRNYAFYMKELFSPGKGVHWTGIIPYIWRNCYLYRE